MCAFSLCCCVWSINSACISTIIRPNRLIISTSAGVCSPEEDTHPGGFCPICHLYTLLIFQTSNLSSPVTCFSGSANSGCAQYRGWTFYGFVFDLFFYRYKQDCQDLTVASPWMQFAFTKMWCQRGHMGYRTLSWGHPDSSPTLLPCRELTSYHFLPVMENVTSFSPLTAYKSPHNRINFHD